MRRAIRPLIALLLIASAGIVLWTVPDVRALINPTVVFSRLEAIASGPWGLPALYLLSASGILLSIPQLAIVSAAALLFPPWAAVCLPWLGCLTGSSVTYFLSRFLFRDAALKFVQRGRAATLVESINRGGFSVMFALRMAFFMFPALNWLPGATGMPYGKYLAGTALGILPWLAVTTYVTKQAGGISSAKDLMTAEVLLPVAGFIAMILVLRRWVSRNKATKAEISADRV